MTQKPHPEDRILATMFREAIRSYEFAARRNFLTPDGRGIRPDAKIGRRDQKHGINLHDIAADIDFIHDDDALFRMGIKHPKKIRRRLYRRWLTKTQIKVFHGESWL